MNNAIIIKNADFSLNKVDELNIQKLTITKAGDGFVSANGASYDINTTGSWDPANEMAYSTEISLPVGTVALFGIETAMTSNANYNTFKTNPGTSISCGTPVWIYHSTDDSLWHTVQGLAWVDEEHRPEMLIAKPNLYSGDNYTAFRSTGAIYGKPFSYNIDKIIINWIKDGSVAAPEVGIALPEFYAVIQ